MRLTSVRLGPDNIGACRGMWGDRLCYTASALTATIGIARDLLRQDRARGAMLLDERGNARYFGLTVFVSEQAADDLLQHPAPRVGAHLLGPAVDSILDRRAIARGNAGNGLVMAVVNQGWDVSGTSHDPWPSLMGALLKDFEDVHAGFRLTTIFGEAFGHDGVAIVAGSGAYPHTATFSVRHRGGELPSIVFWIHRQEAVEGWSPMLPMFAYDPPRAFFTHREQQILREALAGATDAVLAARLGLSLAAVKGAWMRMLQRSSTRIPELLPLKDKGSASSRGAQKRHILLEFVRRHPAELTPYDRVWNGSAVRSSGRARAAERRR